LGDGSDLDFIYLGIWDQEDHGPRQVQTNSSRDPISKIIRAKWTGGVALQQDTLFTKEAWVGVEAFTIADEDPRSVVRGPEFESLLCLPYSCTLIHPFALLQVPPVNS
jgi:hypothetical protein